MVHAAVWTAHMADIPRPPPDWPSELTHKVSDRRLPNSLSHTPAIKSPFFGGGGKREGQPREKNASCLEAKSDGFID